MKGRKFVGVLMIILAVALIMVGALAAVEIPIEKEAIGEAKLLNDGKYNSNNAGEKITIILDYKSLEHAEDKQLGLEFWSTVVRRDVERFERQENGQYHWRNVSINSVNPLRFKTLYGETNRGDRVSIDPQFEKKITTKENLGVEDLTDWSLKNYKEGKTKKKLHAIVIDDVTYFTNAGKVAFGDMKNVSDKKLRKQVGKFRVKYTKMDLHQKAVAITGVQRGHLIKVNPNIGKPIVTTSKVQKLVTKENIIERMMVNRTIIFSTSIVGAIILIIIGLGWAGIYMSREQKRIKAIAEARRKREEEAEARERAWEADGNISRDSNEIDDEKDKDVEDDNLEGEDDKSLKKEYRNRDYIGEEKARKKIERKMAKNGEKDNN